MKNNLFEEMSKMSLGEHREEMKDVTVKRTDDCIEGRHCYQASCLLLSRKKKGMRTLGRV